MRVFRCDICLEQVDAKRLSVLRHPFFLIDGRQDVCDKCDKEFQDDLLNTLATVGEIQEKLEMRAFKKFIREKKK